MSVRSNFEVSVPSIPGRRIRFKIQDIKASGFGSQQERFARNKVFLTKHFIGSFNNFE
jgi:hypothetical protein